jgi:hypothetical protein
MKNLQLNKISGNILLSKSREKTPTNYKNGNGNIQLSSGGDKSGSNTRENFKISNAIEPILRKA